MGSHLSPGVAIDYYIFETGLTASDQETIEEAFRHYPIRFIWVRTDVEIFKAKVQPGHWSSYFRFLIGEKLPDSLEKVLYLDADILVLDDISAIWTWPLQGAVAACVQLRPTLAVALDFAPEEIVLENDTPAFNAGVMLIDLQQWRQKQSGRLALQFAYKYKDRFKAWDQDALNCALYGLWVKLPLRWNVRPDVFGFAPWKEGPYPLAEERQALKTPAILHFAGENKPWLPFSKHPYKKLFFYYLSFTPWKDWKMRGSISLWVKETLVSYPTRKLNRLLEIAIKTKKAKAGFGKYRKHLLLTLLAYPWLIVVYPLQRNNLLKRWLSN